MSGRSLPTQATCPDCGLQRTVKLCLGKAQREAGITRRCAPCAGKHAHPPAFATRSCPDCGDRAEMPVANLRVDGRRARPGSVVEKRCRRCAFEAIAPLGRYGTFRGAVPRDDIDEVMVDRLMGGRDKGGNIAERLEAASRLLGLYRLPVVLVAERLGVSAKTVGRYKHELRNTGRLAA